MERLNRLGDTTSTGFEVIRQTTPDVYADWSLPPLLLGLMECVNRWVWVVALLGLGHRLLRSGSSVPRYLLEAAFPFYILHLPINTLVGYYVIRLQAGVAVKYILVVVTAATTFAAYEIVRRVGPLRLLMGMRGSVGNGRRVQQWSPGVKH